MSKILAVEPLGFPWKTQDPFLFCAYHRDEYPKGNTTMGVDESLLAGRNIGQDFTLKDGWRMYHGREIPGFPYHPHRGFETITINKEGVVDHSDSMGAAGRFMTGDVQWMTAGRGVQHSEMFPLLQSNQANPLEIFQLWLNLPKVSKMVDPHFKMFWSEEVPEIKEKDVFGQHTTVQIIAGKINKTSALPPNPNSWAANAENGVGVYTVKMEPQAEWILPKNSKECSRTIFFYKGKNLVIEGEHIPSNHYIEALADVDLSIVNGVTTAYLLILEGKPIGEPVVQHGPFVMNTQAEIREAMKEYGTTQFGGWPWPKTEVVHSITKGRFAKYADGTEETR